MALSLTKPVKYEDVDKWIVHIIREDGLLIGEVGIGYGPEDATRKAQKVIDKANEAAAENKRQHLYYKEIARQTKEQE